MTQGKKVVRPRTANVKQPVQKPDSLDAGDKVSFGMTAEIKGKWLRADASVTKRPGETDAEVGERAAQFAIDLLDTQVENLFG